MKGEPPGVVPTRDAALAPLDFDSDPPMLDASQCLRLE
jgi:hypothetical protein